MLTQKSFPPQVGILKKIVHSVIGLQFTSDGFFLAIVQPNKVLLTDFLPEQSHIQITWCHFFFHMTKAVNTQSAL